jgi:hypothetical protein
MPDLGVPSAPQPHTSTQEWQSFEIRMRRRRAERCLVRAEVALEAGFEDEARAALDEARRLDWHSPDFESLQAQIDLRRAAETARRDRRRQVLYAAVLLFGVMTAAALLMVMPVREGQGIAANERVESAPSTAPAAPAVPASQPAGPPVKTEPVQETPPAAVPDPVSTAVANERREPRTTDQIRADEDRPERVVPTRGDNTTGVKRPELPVRDATDAARMLPQVPVPTSSAPVQQAVLDPSGAIAKNPIPTVAPPAAEPRALDLPAAPPVAPLAPPRAEPPAAPDDSGVRAALAQYESAYSSLNAAGANAVYPGVDERSLQRAFESLDSQRVSLGRCSISMNGARAQATCQGNATWTPKVGGGTRSAARTWRFDLANSGGSWKITRADAR